MSIQPKLFSSKDGCTEMPGGAVPAPSPGTHAQTEPGRLLAGPGQSSAGGAHQQEGQHEQLSITANPGFVNRIDVT